METPQNKRQWSPVPDNDHEYVDKYSKSATPALLWGIVIFLMLAGFAVWRWYIINEWEQTGTGGRMHVLEWGLYKAGGKWAVSAFYAATALLGLVAGIRKWKFRKDLKQQ